ncbi:MAG TPA: hypothetical protein VMH82_13100 [Myxococcota bacterium]|jgi:hypothetical protein|nr:hypothetical protein [Myxococcota bacterium]
MHDHEIPSAFLIRALARRDSDHCEHCGGRMFVRSASGLCPFCASGRPRSVACLTTPARPGDPLAPRLRDVTGPSGRWQRLRMRARRRAAPALEPHPSTG